VDALTDAPAERAPFSARLALWLKHHTASGLATGVDLLMMVASVEILHLHPVPAVAVGATSGAIANFLLLRYWTYRNSIYGGVAVASPGQNVENPHVSLARQILRYAVVSGGSLGWNTLGEYLFVSVFGVQYVLGRVITAVVVSNVWNFPMQRWFVFTPSRVNRS